MNKTLSTLMGASVLATGLMAFVPSQAQASISIYLGNTVNTVPFFEQAPSYSYSQSGINVTATGVSNGSTPRNVTRGALGLGVYTPGILGLDNPEIDGLGPDETLKLKIDPKVILKSITFAEVDRGDEFTLLVDGNQFVVDQTIPFNPDGPLGLVDLISKFTFNPAPTGNEFGIAVTDNFDQYFVKYIEVSPVPEPLTLLGSGIALGFGGYMKRKLGKSKKA